MSDIENVLAHAWNKDAVNLAPALDAVMSSKAADAIQGMYSSVAASLFGQEVHNEEVPQEQQEIQQTEDLPDQTHEEPSNVDSE
jgi:hypothetical protein